MGDWVDYPNDFNTPAFPAGKTIALTRTVSIWILIVFFFIVVACGFLLLGRHLKKNFPFLISVDTVMEEWNVVSYPDEHKKPIPQYQYIQQKLVNDFAKDWFTISTDPDINNDIWQKCSLEECNSPQQFNPENKYCALSCKSAESVFDVFMKKVLPDYKARIDQANEIWDVSNEVISSKPEKISQDASKWLVRINVKSSVNGNFRVLAFIEIERNVNLYPATFGYYVSKFNSYRITK